MNILNGDIMEIKLEINNREEMIKLGEKLGKELKANMIVTLEGDLGAGKTTLTKGIAKGLDIKTIVNSPTFTIMKIYDGRLRLYHLDVYRIDSDDFELQEYFEDGGVCVIEWANNIKELLPKELLNIVIKDLGNDRREVTISSDDEDYCKIIEVLK